MLQHDGLTIAGDHKAPQLESWPTATLRRQTPGGQGGQEISMGFGPRKITADVVVHNSYSTEAAAWAAIKAFDQRLEVNGTLAYYNAANALVDEWPNCTFDGFQMTQKPLPGSGVGWWFRGVFSWTQLGPELPPVPAVTP